MEPGGERNDGGPRTRSGYVALVGRPNVGKSTLLNAFLGEKLSIVTPRAQTTRERVTGIHTTTDTQIVFVDTPGILEPRYTLQRSMLESALAALEDSDAVLVLLDATRPAETVPTGEPLESLQQRRDRLFVAINKIDEASAEAIDELAVWCREALGVEPFPISAASGEGVAELGEVLESVLPEGPFLYPPDELATQPVRFFVAEFVRETVFEQYHEEVPYSTVVRIEEFREAEEPIYIRATVYVERESQKAILIGRGGSAIRRLGQRSRQKIEAFLNSPVYLDLWVKVLPNWRRKRSALRYLGYPVPEPENGRSDR